MRISKAFLRAFLFCIVLILCVLFLNFLLVPYSSMMKRFRSFHEEEKNGNIDMLVIGSSLEFNSVDPEVMSEESGLHCAVFAPQGTNTETAYNCLVDALGANKISTVIIGWTMLDRFEYPYKPYPSNRRAQMYREMLCHSKHNFPLLALALKNIMKQRYTMTLFEYAAFPENAAQIKKAMQSRKYKKLPFEPESFFEKAMNMNDIYNPKYELVDVLACSYAKKPNPAENEYIEKIRDLCKEKEVDLYFISCPYPEIVQSKVRDYGLMLDESRKLFKSFSVNFIDMQQNFPEISGNENYHDCGGHLIIAAKVAYTKALVRYLKSCGN